MTDQPMPRSGGASVPAVLAQRFPALLAERVARGIATYGCELTTWNGRDAARDAEEEWLDLGQYLIQARMEHDDLVDIVRPMVQDLVDAVREAEYSLDGVAPSHQMVAFISVRDVLRLAAILGVKP